MTHIPEFDAILAGLKPIPVSGRPASRPMWVAPELLETMRRYRPSAAPLQLEMPGRRELQVDDQIDLPKPPKHTRRR
jgi:hypothetical protein